MAENNTQEQEELQKQEAEAIMNWYGQIRQILTENFEDYSVEGQIGQHPAYGPMFVYTLSRDAAQHSCGFMLAELVEHFRESSDPILWLTSFFVDMVNSLDSHPLPEPPQTEEEAGVIFDKQIVPACSQGVREEFPDDEVYVDLEMHPEHGPVLEAGFPAIREGNNVCAMPLHFLLTLHLMNRDPSEPVIQAMYRMKEAQ